MIKGLLVLRSPQRGFAPGQGRGRSPLAFGHMVKKTSWGKVCAINRHGQMGTVFEMAKPNRFTSGLSVWAEAELGTAKHIGDAKSMSG
jgi:hypothetical protein